MGRKSSRHIRPQLSTLEDRLAPAINLTIDGDMPTADVDIDTTTLGLKVYTPAAGGATLAVADIAAALAAGDDVVIRTGEVFGGVEEGAILWVDDSPDGFDDLILGAAAGSLTFDTSAVAVDPAAATVTLTDVTLLGTAADFAVTTAGAAADFTGAAVVGRSLTVAVGAGDFTFSDLNMVGDVTVTAATITGASAATLSSSVDGAAILLNGELTGTDTVNITLLGETGSTTLGGGAAVTAVSGTFDLTISSPAAAVLKPVSLDGTLTVDGGVTTYGTTALAATAVSVGGNFVAAVLAGTGTITGDVTVYTDGALAPGGVGTAGTMTVVGNVTFDGGAFFADLGAAADKLVVTEIAPGVGGELVINSGSTLGGPADVGLAAGAGSVLAEADGGITGEFDNAPAGDPFNLADDTVSADYQDGAPDRLVVTHVVNPPINLVIDGDDVTFNVAVDTSVPGLTKFTATGFGAVLDVAEIERALEDGDVTVSLGAAATGSILWDSDTENDDLDLGDLDADRTLTLDTSGVTAAAAADISLPNVGLSGAGDIGFVFKTAGATVDLGATVVLEAAFLTVTAGTFLFQNTLAVGDITVTADAIQPVGLGIMTAYGDITLKGEVQLTTPTYISLLGGGALTLAGGTADDAVSGDGDLYLSAGAIKIEKPITMFGGAELIFADGLVNVGDNDIIADVISVGDGVNDDAVLGAGDGFIFGDVTVYADGVLSPGGAGATGVLTIFGDVEVVGGRYDPDLGEDPDLLDIDGDLFLDEAVIGGAGTGLADADPIDPAGTPIIGVTGEVFGTFDNAPDDTTAALVGADAVFVTYQEDIGDSIFVNPADAVPGGKVFAGADFDATGYTVKLTGPGELAVVPGDGLHTGPGDNLPSFVVRNATGASNLTITTKANGSDNVLVAGQIVVTAADGAPAALGTLSAATTDVDGGVRILGGAAKAVTVRDLYGPVTVGGLVTDKTAFKARNVYDDVTANGVLTSVTVAGSLSAAVTAAKIGPVTAATAGFFGFAGLRATAGPVGAVKVAGLAVGLDVSATGPIGQITLGGSPLVPAQLFVSTPAAVAGIKAARDVILSVDAGSVGAVSAAGSFIGEVTAAGKIASVTAGEFASMDLTAGSVGAVKVGGSLIGEWVVTGGVTSITAGGVGAVFAGFDLTAGFLGSLTVKGNAKLDVPADVTESTFTLTGNHLAGSPANPAGFGIRTVTITGNVDGSTFTLLKGSLMTFKAARFLNSNIYMDYTPTPPFDTGGAFPLGGVAYKLGTFTTTAKTLNDVNHPLNYSFANSQIAAPTVGTINLSTAVDTTNGGAAFGIKFKAITGTAKGAGAALVNEGNFHIIDL